MKSDIQKIADLLTDDPDIILETRPEKPAFVNRMNNGFDPIQEIEEDILKLMAIMGLDLPTDRQTASGIVGEVKRIAYRIFEIDEQDIPEEQKIDAIRKQGIAPPSDLPPLKKNAWYKAMMELVFNTIGKTKFGI